MFLEKAVLKVCSKFTGEHPCRSVISIKLQSNFIETTLRHGCSPVNLLHILRRPFPGNTSGWLLLQNPIQQLLQCCQITSQCWVIQGDTSFKSLSILFFCLLNYNCTYKEHLQLIPTRLNWIDQFLKKPYIYVTYGNLFQTVFSTLRASSSKWSNTPKQFVGCLSRFDHFEGLELKGLINFHKEKSQKNP